MKNNVLLIGGAGFIGSRFLQCSKHKCTVFDKVHNQDINHTLLNAPFDTVLFLAAEPNLRSAIANPEHAYATMTQGLHRCLRQYKNSHFVFMSSSMVYGDWTQPYMSELDPACPSNIYGQLKLLGEGIVKQFHDNWTIVRPSAVYGPGDNPNRVVNLFIDKIRKHEPISLQGADNLFDFTYVDDVVQGLERIVDRVPSNQTYNLTRGEAHTLQAMTEMLYQKLGVAENFTASPRPDNYPQRGSLNIHKAITELDYVPEWELSRGLDDTINKS